MSQYLTLTVPEAIAPIADKIAVTFEPDSSCNPSTYDAFSNGLKVMDGTNQRRAYGVTVNDEIAASAPLWKLSPSQLQAELVQVYAARWPDQDAPSLADTEAFCTDVTMSSQYGVMAGISELGYSMVQDAGQ